MHFVLDAPVASDRAAKLGRIQRQTRKINAPLDRDVSVNLAGGLDQTAALQAFPFGASSKPIQFRTLKVTSFLPSAMILLDCFKRSQRSCGFGKLGSSRTRCLQFCQNSFEERAYLLVHRFL